MKSIRLLSLITGLALILSASGCIVRDSSGRTTGRGAIQIDGSSTVEPISQAVAEEFLALNPQVRMMVGTSGTGGGFAKFILGEIDINDASRPIKASEIKGCEQNGVEYLEVKVAIDGLSVVVNAENDWCDCLSVEQLRTIWQRGSTVTTWRDVNSAWPDEPIKLYGPDTESGTFDYFTEAICGAAGNTRSDYQPSTNDNVLVQGVAGDKYSLGYFGYAYYAENKDKMKLVGVSASGDPADCILPTDETIEAGEYAPLSRPLFIYVNKRSLQRPEVADFLRFYLNEGQDYVAEVGYVRLGPQMLAEMRQQLEDAIGGK
jgi:phosphate transport system substrate-binding protein